MKTIKSVISAVIFSALIVITGCSDMITSSGETGSSEKGEVVSNITGQTLPVLKK